MERSKSNCVRCGDEFPTYEDGATYLRPLSTAVSQYGEQNTAADRDHPSGYLCPDCADDYDEFMEGDDS